MISSRYKAILFDWDDTISYTDPHRYVHTRQVAGQFGHQFTMEDIYLAFARADHTGITTEGDWVGAIAHELGLHDDHHPEFRDLFSQRDAIKKQRLYDDAVAVFDRLKVTGIRIGVLSNNRYVHDAVRAMQVEDHFEIVVSPDTYGVGKPDPVIFKRTIAAMNLNSSEVLYVGDSYDFDVVGARAAGITPALIDRFGLQIQEHQDAEHRLTSLEQLHEVLARSSATPAPTGGSSTQPVIHGDDRD